jgi:hypothetical protein
MYLNETIHFAHFVNKKKEARASAANLGKKQKRQK